MASLVEIFYDHVTAYFTRFRYFVMRRDAEFPPRLSTITRELLLALSQLHETTRQRVSRYIIPDNERGPTGSHYRGENEVDLLGKHTVLDKAIKELEKTTDDRSSSHEDGKCKRKRSKRSASS